MNNKDFQNGLIVGLASGGVVEVIDTTEIDNLEDLIDNSGVLEDTEGSVAEKVEELIDKAKNGGSASIDENGIITFGGSTTINENGIVSL
jgi:hypothetical protein